MSPSVEELRVLGDRLVRDGPEHIMPANRRVRILFFGQWIVDTNEATLVWEKPYYPYFYVPVATLHSSVESSSLSTPATSVHYSISSLIFNGSKERLQVLLFNSDLQGAAASLSRLARIDFNDVEWFVEDEPIYVHPRDPFKRVDIYPSQRSIKISLDGHTLAESSSCMMLHETSLPTRYYISKTCVDWRLLKTSCLKTQCPYKGEAEYYDIVADGIQGGENLVWWYRYPTKESLEVAGMVCFYNEKVDIELDGMLLERPKTHFV